MKALILFFALIGTVHAGELDRWSLDLRLGTPLMDDPIRKSGVEWGQGDPVFAADLRRWFSCNAYVSLEHMSQVNRHDRGPNILSLGYRWGRCR